MGHKTKTEELWCRTVHRCAGCRAEEAQRGRSGERTAAIGHEEVRALRGERAADLGPIHERTGRLYDEDVD